MLLIPVMTQTRRVSKDRAQRKRRKRAARSRPHQMVLLTVAEILFFIQARRFSTAAEPGRLPQAEPTRKTSQDRPNAAGRGRRLGKPLFFRRIEVISSQARLPAKNPIRFISQRRLQERMRRRKRKVSPRGIRLRFKELTVSPIPCERRIKEKPIGRIDPERTVCVSMPIISRKRVVSRRMAKEKSAYARIEAASPLTRDFQIFSGSFLDDGGGD